MVKLKYIGFGAGALIVGAGIAVGVMLFSHHTTPEVPTRQSDVLTTTVETPSEAHPAASYSVPDGAPLSIEIASVGIKGYIQKVGVDQHQAVTAPNNIHLAGWFVESVLPGHKGLSIIDGHEGGPTMDGIFKRLPEVKKDDAIIVTMGGGITYTYKVFNVQAVDKDEAAAMLFDQSPRSTKGQLNLITCTGTYSDKERTYDKRAVVYAALQ